MRIAHLLPNTAVFPLSKHNGRYDWVLGLARIQAKAGHAVTIFAGAGSTDSEYPSIVWRSLDNLTDDKRANNLALLSMAFNDKSQDIYHSHFDYLHYYVADMTDQPVIVTQHWFPFQEIADSVQLNKTHNVLAVPVTKLMRQEDERLGIPCGDCIYHGIDLELFKPGRQHGDRFIFVGRVTPDKGVAEAIKYAKEAGVGLDIIGKIKDKDQEFWAGLQPQVDGRQICYLGSKTQQEVVEAFRLAKALIFPSQSAEAFGLVTVEAQACGTPVIISDAGASAELVLDGKTGYICDSEEAFIDAIKLVGQIDRTACRQFAERFDVKTMVERYMKLYEAKLSVIA